MRTQFVLQIIAAAIIGGTGGLWLGHDALSAASSNLVSALSVLNAAIFPTVILSATVLKPANMTVGLVERYRVALKRQISFFFGMLLFSLLTILAIMVGQTMNWKFPATLPWVGWERSLDGIYNFAILFFVAFVALRLPAFFRALISLVDVHIDSVTSEVSRREQEVAKSIRTEIADMPAIPTSAQNSQPFPIS